MKILFGAPSYVGLLGEKSGVWREMRNRAGSLIQAGNTVDFLDTRHPPLWKNYDIAHLFMASGDTLGLGTELAKNLPLVVSPIIDNIHSGFLLRGAVALDRWIPRVYTHPGQCARLCNLARLVVLRSGDEQRRLENDLGVRGKSWLALCPVPPPEGMVRETSAKGQTKKTVLFLGDMGNRRKNVHKLLEAAVGLEAELCLAGLPPAGLEKGRLESASRVLENVRWAGPVDELAKAELFRECDVFVLPSLMEGIGLAAVEAGFMRKTVVITQVGGARDYFGDDAYYVNPNSVRSIRDGLRAALKTPRDPSAALKSRLDMRALGDRLAAGYERALSRESGQ